MAARRSASLAAWQRDAVRHVVSSRRSLLAFVARLPGPAILRPRTQDQWSVKDVLGHLLACDEETTRRFQLIARGQGDRIHWFESMADADRFNARTVARARRLRLPAVLRRMETARADLVEALERLPPASLRDPAHAYPVVEWLPEPGWTHVLEHLGEIKAWWRAERGRGRSASPDRAIAGSRGRATAAASARRAGPRPARRTATRGR
jgi:hypothetical protein